MTGLVELVPIFNDNYVFFIRENETSQFVNLVDPGESEKCLRFLEEKKLILKNILVTHHHADHIDGIENLKSHCKSVQIYAPLKNKNQMPWAHHYVSQDQILKIENFNFKVLELPGHTQGHIGYFESQRNWLFSGDVLFGLGCGRLFEGNPEMMMASLQKIKLLPIETLIFCTHEYTLTNLNFTEYLIKTERIPKGFDFELFSEYKNEILEKRNSGLATVPLSLGTQLQVNPFLVATDLTEWAELRHLRNQF
jgi:hydroxyacylglutathione hydrolase